LCDILIFIENIPNNWGVLSKKTEEVMEKLFKQVLFLKAFAIIIAFALVIVSLRIGNLTPICSYVGGLLTYITIDLCGILLIWVNSKN